MEIKKVALTAGIAVLFTLFIVFFVEAVYESPEYEDYCGFYREPYPLTKDPASCPVVYNQELFDECITQKGEVRYNISENGCQTDPYCDFCSRDFNDANTKYHKSIFFISAIVSIIAILAGLYLPKNIDAIASGFIFGGILVLVQGTARVFGDLGKWPRVIVLGAELIILIIIGLKRLKK